MKTRSARSTISRFALVILTSGVVLGHTNALEQQSSGAATAFAAAHPECLKDAVRRVAGDRFTAADLYVGALLGYSMQFGTIPKRPAFESYYAKVSDRPAAKRAAQLDDAVMPKQVGT